MSVPGVAEWLNTAGTQPRHSAVVRITHWVVVLSVLGLLLSGIGILISHPRLYWGEAGYVGADSLVDVPLPFVIGPSVWNRPIHFLFAWCLTFAGLTYVACGFITRHFRNDLMLGKAGTNPAGTYNVIQRLTYLAVVFGLFPAIFWTGLAMSFGVTSVFPVMAVALGGHQSARTLHFAFVALLLLFVAVHVVMVYTAGFVNNIRSMLTGRVSAERNLNE